MSQHPSRARDYLDHMLDAIGRIQEYVGGKTAEDFLSDRLLQDAVIRNIEILGEASRKLLAAAPDTAKAFPGIPFAAIYGMRNRLTHGYFTIDTEMVWEVIERDLPALRTELEAAIRSLNKPTT